MGDSSQDDDKQFEPTQKKLDDARKKGEIARSTDINTTASYTGILIVAIALGSGLLSKLGNLLSRLISDSETISTTFFNDSAHPVVGQIMLSIIVNVSPWMLLPGMVVLLTIIAQRSLIFAPSKLAPKLSRISLLSNAKNKFGRSGLFEFAKSFTKLLIYSAVLGVFLKTKLPEILGSANSTPTIATGILFRLIIEFLSIILIISLAIGIIDLIWQKAEHNRRNKMSRKDMTDEAKQSEGDPHTKQQRRQKGYSIAMNQMLADVPEADVIIVNPTHFAIALKWNRTSGGAPSCVAKGVDEVAAKIREVAAQSGVPIHRDPPTARALYSSVDIGQEILPEHYHTVAAAIRFAEKMRKKAIFK